MTSNKESAGRAWYVVQCKVRQEERAEENLRRQDYVCYHPKFRRERLVKGRREIAEESLFPGYLFVHLSQEDNWGPLRSTRGVNRIVSFGNQPAVLSDGLIEQLQRREHEPCVEELLSIGERVRINEGPFADLEAIFLAMDGETRVVLLLNFLQREQKLLMPLTGVRKL
ncbi:transcription/translation regulatory transformer protein RfaH [Metapseudomonas boanensis]|uniref:Transcription antitermination protein RfaH n=1 Tax=Metapseudomonas boanensis TaxID=2822138 RepID=A0ABS5XDP4_9GAMM|nr:transcription/translation regulatory transformer protein RfaH [Pseudomonas boanensis]MBT8765806.1 transcription/translation regulatory transformer protein RfaH [Pseudomonas boanensis]